MALAPRMHQYFHHEINPVFITTNVEDCFKLFDNEVFCQIIWDEMFFYAEKYQVEVLAFVIMPEHLHCIVWPQGEKTFSDYMQGVKGFSAKLFLEHLDRRQQLLPPIDDEMKRATDPSHERGLTERIWQPGFFSYIINSIDNRVILFCNSDINR